MAGGWGSSSGVTVQEGPPSLLQPFSLATSSSPMSFKGVCELMDSCSSIPDLPAETQTHVPTAWLTCPLGYLLEISE